MAKNMDPTMEDMRREQASLRAVWEKNGQKQLNAITVKLAEKENQTPIPVTMAGLRQLDRMASDMGMGGLKPVQKNEVGSQVAGQALAKAQSSNNKNVYMHPEFREDNTIPYAAHPGEYAKSPLTMAGLRQDSALVKQKPPYIQPMPRPEPSSSQSASQYGPYFDMEREYPITMAGLRQAEFQHERNAKIQRSVTNASEVLVPIADLHLQAIEAFAKSEDAVKAAKVGGKALTIIGYIGDAADIEKAVRTDLSDSDKRLGKKTATAVGGVASSALFSYIGTALGTALVVGAAGALSGSIVPGAGTAVGFIGGFIGGLIGAAVGEDFSELVIDQIDWNE